MNKTLLPKLRFPEFQEVWDVEKLGNISMFINERVPLEKLSLNNYISTENILPDYEGVTKASKLPPSGSAIQYKKDDILISNIRPYLKKVWFSNKEGGASNDVIIVRAKEKITAKYLSFMLRNDVFIEYVMNGAQGVKMPRGDIFLMKEYPLAYPSKSEQQKIADCLTSLDDLIATHSQKVEALQVYKKGLMQNLFPAEGESVPKLRFPEFQPAGEWEENTLESKVTKVGSGITPKGGESNYKNKGIPFIRSQNVGWGELILDDVVFIDYDTHATFIATEIREGDVLLNITGASIGRSTIADSRIHGGNVNQHVCIIRVKNNELSPEFLNQYLLSQYGQVQIESFQAGGNRQGLNFAQIRSFSIPLPQNIEEQRRIADLLTAFDEQISAQRETLAALKIHRKGLMQQLFPSEGSLTQ